MTWKYGNHALKVPAKRYRIGELVRYSPFSRQTIHNYTIMGLIHEVEWTQGGHRLYDESVFGRLSQIMELRKTKSLTEIRRILSEVEDAPPGPATGREEHATDGPDALKDSDSMDVGPTP
jgi:DNA-binding transcriptional MerR regulator